MATMSGRGAMTHAADHNKGEKDDEGSTEAQYAEMGAQDDAAMDGCAGASAAASTLTPFSEPPQTTNPARQGAPARQLTATNATVQIADPTTVTLVPQGQTATAPAGSTVTLGTGTTMHVNSGSVTVMGAGTGTRVENVPVTINVGSTVKTLGTCYEGRTVVPANTHLTATSSPITLTQYHHVKVVVELVSGSATTGTGTHMAEVITNTHQTATATVGAAAASITNIQGMVTITAVTPNRHPELV